MLVDALPGSSGMAFILVQHLDPTHKSMMVDLLAGHTAMTVRQAEDGMPIEREHLYVIPPGSYLAIANGVLPLTPPVERHGARLPFDFLLHSLAEECGARAVCVILSGTGGDGSLGLQAVKAKSGFVVAQDPDEAGYDGMPRSAIATGAVDLVCPVAAIPAALIDHARQASQPDTNGRMSPRAGSQDPLSEILGLVRARTVHDFTHYKPGTLQRRIERRMALAAIGPHDMARYLAALRSDPSEVDQLAKDLLINVTGFFRDPPVFELLAEKIIPDLVSSLQSEHSLRIWIAGCSTGEEAYSLAMLLCEQIAAASPITAISKLKLQVFASDVDAEAVAVAREGFYPATIRADVSPERLARFFVMEDNGYRVAPELRATVVFTVQDVLTDPPFSRLDLVSCRNLLIYLGAEAQAKVITSFHFALKQGGILLLGNSETVGDASGRFEVISKAARVYRHIGRTRPSDFNFAATGDVVRLPARSGRGAAPSRQSVLAGLCSRFLMEHHSPATIISNRKHECLYSMGPTERYLRVAPGQPTNDLLAMVREDKHIRLRTAMQRAIEENARVTVPGGLTVQDGRPVRFVIKVQPVVNDGEELLLICFVDKPGRERTHDRADRAHDIPRVAELEQ
ncbi:MAG: histidine kinase, partial [Pseudomonadota bacterium]|nr:histidine kinase [Pseudomonadota bacterium]